jgi:hypothetical protein
VGFEAHLDEVRERRERSDDRDRDVDATFRWGATGTLGRKSRKPHAERPEREPEK